MARRSNSIHRTKRLAQEVSTLMSARGRNQRELAEESEVGFGTVGRLLHPNDHQGVSAKNFAKIVAHLTDSPDEATHLFELAHTPVPRSFGEVVRSAGAGERVNMMLRASGLTEEFQAMAEDIIISNARTTIKNLKVAQAHQDELKALVPTRRSRSSQRVVS